MQKFFQTTFGHKYKKEIKAYLLILLPLLWWGVFFVYAFFRAFYFSFTDLGLRVNQISSFTFENYVALFDSTSRYASEFWNSMKVTMIWAFTMMFLNNFMGLLAAFLIDTLKKGRRLFLALLFWPSLVSAVVGSDIALTIFSGDEAGLANQIVMFFGGQPQQWFDQESTALIALMVTPFFFGFCTKMLIYYSSLISIPANYKEAASLDTSSNLRMFWSVTLPLMKNAIVLNLLLSLIDGFKILGPMQLVTSGGPNKSTQSVMLMIYNLAFKSGKMGLASAAAFVLFVVIILFTVIQMMLSGKEAESIG